MTRTIFKFFLSVINQSPLFFIAISAKLSLAYLAYVSKIEFFIFRKKKIFN